MFTKELCKLPEIFNTLFQILLKHKNLRKNRNWNFQELSGLVDEHAVGIGVGREHGLEEGKGGARRGTLRHEGRQAEDSRVHRYQYTQVSSFFLKKR